MKKPKYSTEFVEKLMADHMTLEEEVECKMWYLYDLNKEDGWEGTPGSGYTWRDPGRFEIRVIETTVMMVDIQMHACTSSVMMIPEAVLKWMPAQPEKMVKFHCPHPALAIALARQLRLICENNTHVCPGVYRRPSTKTLQAEAAELKRIHDEYEDDEDYR